MPNETKVAKKGSQSNANSGISAQRPAVGRLIDLRQGTEATYGRSLYSSFCLFV